MVRIIPVNKKNIARIDVIFKMFESLFIIVKSLFITIMVAIIFIMTRYKNNLNAHAL